MYDEKYYSETFSKIGKSIFIFNEIEFFIDCIICHYVKPKNREFYIHYILNTSITSFGTKIKMLEIFNSFENAKITIDEIKLLRSFSRFRNTFAHSNRNFYPNVTISETDPLIPEKVTTINIDFEDIIYVSKSSDKIDREKYDDYVIKHKDLQNNVIIFLTEYVARHDISVRPGGPNNLKKFLTE